MEKIITEMRDQIKIIYLNQPKGNKFTKEMLNELKNELNKKEDIIGILLSGKGKHFSVGGDLDGMIEAMEQGNPTKYVSDVVPIVNSIIVSILTSPLPIICALNGSAAGGGLSLALACDYRVAVQEAKFSMAFGNLALSPDSGSSFLFPLRFGKFNALKGISIGKIFKASEALDLGAIDDIVDKSNLISSGIDIIKELTSKSLWTFSKSKELLNADLLDLAQTQLEKEFSLIKQSSLRDDYKQKLVALKSSLNNK